MKFSWPEIRQHIAGWYNDIKKNGGPYLRTNLLNRQFLIYAAVAVILTLFSIPENFMEFNSSTDTATEDDRLHPAQRR